jgi:hypothetical protein
MKEEIMWRRYKKWMNELEKKDPDEAGWKWEGTHLPSTDAQRSKLYQAERDAFPGMDHDMQANHEQLVQFMDDVWAAPINQELKRVKYSQVFLRITPSKSRSFATRNVISLSRPMMNRIVLLHELAHLFTFGHRHGPVFADCFAILIGRCIGPAHESRLRACYESHGVKAAGKKPEKTIMIMFPSYASEPPSGKVKKPCCKKSQKSARILIKRVEAYQKKYQWGSYAQSQLEIAKAALVKVLAESQKEDLR